LSAAAIVFAVATWQWYVEELARAHLHGLAVRQEAGYTNVFQLLEAEIEEQISRFATPNAESTRQLLRRVGYDPASYWTPGAPDTIDDWLAVRHAIAHGGDVTPKQRGRVERILLEGTMDRLSRGDADACIRFFTDLTYRTSDGASSTLAAAAP
jgi:hypothetical protein